MQLVAPQPEQWRCRFEAHCQRIQAAFHEATFHEATVDHIGSTAIPGIHAKDVIDLLVGTDSAGFDRIHDGLKRLGYVSEGRHEKHSWLCWPTPERREAVVHVMVLGERPHRQRLAFRDALCADSALASKYETLKLKLAAQTDDWGDYTNGKAAFVNGVVAQGGSVDAL